jgi:hypothetical protein
MSLDDLLHEIDQWLEYVREMEGTLVFMDRFPSLADPEFTSPAFAQNSRDMAENLRLEQMTLYKVLRQAGIETQGGHISIDEIREKFSGPEPELHRPTIGQALWNVLAFKPMFTMMRTRAKYFLMRDNFAIHLARHQMTRSATRSTEACLRAQ